MNKIFEDETYVKLVRGVLGVIITLTMCVLIFIKLPENNITMILVGALVSMANTVYQFYFGSSQGSVDKSKLMKTGSQN
jgi:uncharacterized protein YacL